MNNAIGPARRISSTVAVGAAVAVVLSMGVADAATGGRFILGKSNAAGAPSVLSNTGSGPALRLHTNSSTTPNLAVSNGAKIKQLNADKLDGLHGSAYERVRTAKRALTPAASPTPATLATVPGLGTFTVACNSTTTEADLAFAKNPAVALVNLVTSRVYDPPGGGPNNSVSTVSTAAATTPSVAFPPVAGPGGIARFTIQLAKATGRAFTVTISLTYSDANIAPGKCAAIAQVL
jgi:hypothetical protein